MPRLIKAVACAMIRYGSRASEAITLIDQLLHVAADRRQFCVGPDVLIVWTDMTRAGVDAIYQIVDGKLFNAAGVYDHSAIALLYNRERPSIATVSTWGNAPLLDCCCPGGKPRLGTDTRVRPGDVQAATYAAIELYIPQYAQEVLDFGRKVTGPDLSVLW